MTARSSRTVRGSGPGLLLAHGAGRVEPTFGPILDGPDQHDRPGHVRARAAEAVAVWFGADEGFDDRMAEFAVSR
jgi:hypothetical protein